MTWSNHSPVMKRDFKVGSEQPKHSALWVLPMKISADRSNADSDGAQCKLGQDTPALPKAR